MANAGAPIQAHSTSESIVAQALFLHGTKAQQDEWLPAIRGGERFFALGYSDGFLLYRSTLFADNWITAQGRIAGDVTDGLSAATGYVQTGPSLVLDVA